ncbi:MAG: Zn-dependent hydrolase [Pseudomonadota bacterium]
MSDQRLDNLTINAERLWGMMMETAEIGRTPKGGIKRLTLTDLDKQVRDWFQKTCEEAGCSVHVDQMGNQYAIRPGRDNSLPPIACGSHLDTQPTGGKFDGILGVLAGVEAIRTLNDAGYETDAPLMVVNWTNEEGSRFAPAMLSSGVYAGAFTQDWAYALTDADGATFGEELERIGFRGEEPVGQREFGAFFELHIEQGPILEAEEKTIGVVTDGQGMRWYDVKVSGRESHAGTTPMPLRKDALVATSRMVVAANEIALANAPNAVATVGVLDIREPSRNVIPGEVSISLEFRHPNDGVMASMDEALRARAKEIEAQDNVDIEIDQIWHFPPVKFDEECVAAVRSATERFGYTHRDMVSGAGHDACYVARKAPTSMVFVPCENGISHNEIENATFDDCAAGANVLMHAMLAKANAG